MLLGEQAMVVLAALPLGAWIGLGMSALLALRFKSELFRIPLVISGSTYAFAWLVVVAAGLLSALAARRRFLNLDLVESLKTRE